MAHNPLAQLTQQIFQFFTVPEKGSLQQAEATGFRFQRCGDLIRYNSENLTKLGDLSLAACSINWNKYCSKHGIALTVSTEHLFEDEQVLARLQEQAKNFIFLFANAAPELSKERYILNFQRRPIIEFVLRTVLAEGLNYGRQKRGADAPTLCLQLKTNNSAEIRSYRAELLFNILRRILDYSKWQLVEPDQLQANTQKVTVQCASQEPGGFQGPDNHIRVISGVVLDPVDKAASTMVSSDYLDLRSNDMLLMAMHRHGIRNVKKIDDREALMRSLGQAAVIVDLFEVRHSSPALMVRSGQGCSKGAPYILYNSARLETLLRSFNEQVEKGVYAPLPPLHEIDFSLLEEDLDWQLIYGYLLAFPELIEASLDQLASGQCAIHTIVRYTFNLASLFSRYYRAKQILVQGRTQLMPLLYARVYLTKVVRQVLNACLALLGIQPVDYM